MFGIGLPEMIVILAVALIVVGPERLPDMARSVAKWMFELKKTVNQVKESLADEENLIDSVHSDLKKTTDELKGNFLDADDHFTRQESGSPASDMDDLGGEEVDLTKLKPVDADRQVSVSDQEEKKGDNPDSAEQAAGQEEVQEGKKDYDSSDKPPA